MAHERTHQDIIHHMAQHFGPVQQKALVEIVPVTGIAINVIRPRPDDFSIILFTTGMSDLPQAVPAQNDPRRYTELILRLPGDWPLDDQSLRNPQYYWPLEWLKRIAVYPRMNDTWLGGPFAIIANGEPPAPFAPSTNLSCMLLLEEPDVAGQVQSRDGKQVALYSMVPLYVEERDLEKAEGMPGLFERFQAHGLRPVVDPQRVNVAVPHRGPMK